MSLTNFRSILIFASCVVGTRNMLFVLRSIQGFSRVMTRPAGGVKGVSKSSRVGSLRLNKVSRVGSGRVKRFSKSRGLGRVGSRGFQYLAGRVGSGQEVFKISRVGSGHDPRDTGQFAGQAIMIRELF